MFKYYATLDFISNQESSIIHNGKLNKCVAFVDDQLLLENWKKFLFGLWQCLTMHSKIH